VIPVAFAMIVILAVLIGRMIRSKRPDGKMLFLESLMTGSSDEHKPE